MKQQAVALFIEGTYPWYRGGVSEWVHQYIHAFPDLEFNIIQVATDEYRDADLSTALYQVPDQVNSLTRVPPPPKGISNIGEANGWFDAIAPKINAISSQSNLLHVANTGFAGWLGLKAARQYRSPLILTEHALYWKEVEMGAAALECGYQVPDEETEKAAMVRLFQAMANAIYTEADHVISVSKCNITEQKCMGAQHVRYIPNGVDEQWLEPQKARNSQPVIGWIGRCAAMKNPLKFFDVIRAFRQQSSIDPRFIMMICDAGEDRLKDKVIAEAARHADLKLVINQPAQNFIAEMDALCITSHNESQPLVLFEALAKKVLPVGWEAGDVTSRYGLIIPKEKSPGTLAEAFYTLWSHPRAWDEMVTDKFSLLQNKHTWQAIFDTYRSLYRPYGIGEEVTCG